MPEIIGTSATIRELHQWIERAAGCVSTVTITGESGTGKELVALTIHERSPRSSAPFVPVNCGAIPDNLIEAELFGHERGAFTGAAAARDGLFAAAQGGTIFLDEFCEMGAPTQVRLLRVLQERKVKRLGSTKEFSVNVRVIVATNKDPAEEMRAGRLREDLYYRINVLPLRLPALRERRGDIPALVAHLLASTVRSNLSFHQTPTITPTALALLLEQDWPGNVRELENTLERLALLAGEGWAITPQHVAEVSRPTKCTRPPTSDERLAAMDALVELAGGNHAEAARMAGLPRMTFYQRRRRAQAKLQPRS
jgi:transcriptional regulator with PAS, ATPase and Fis domain